MTDDKKRCPYVKFVDHEFHGVLYNISRRREYCNVEGVNYPTCEDPSNFENCSIYKSINNKTK